MAASTSLILVGRHLALGKTLGPARAAGNGKEDRHLQAGKSWEDSRADLKGKETFALPERKTSSPMPLTLCSV